MKQIAITLIQEAVHAGARSHKSCAIQGIYIASESSFYRVLKAHEQLNRCGRTQPPRPLAEPRSWVATAPNQVWSWNITYLPSALRGQFYTRTMVVQ